MASVLVTSFWKTVEDCLVEFHDLTAFAAQEKVRDYREQLAKEARQLGTEWMEDLVYHAEPWRLACDLAGRELDLSDYCGEYQRIRSKNGLIGFNLQPVTVGQNYPSFLKM